MITVYDVWAEWCSPCKRFSPIFEKISSEFSNAAFEKVNADENLDFLNQFGIRSIPTILIVDTESGNVLFQHAGILSEAAFRAVVTTYYSKSI